MKSYLKKLVVDYLSVNGPATKEDLVAAFAYQIPAAMAIRFVLRGVKGEKREKREARDTIDVLVAKGRMQCTGEFVRNFVFSGDLVRQGDGRICLPD